jgi:translation initiation factor IF-1
MTKEERLPPPQVNIDEVLHGGWFGVMPENNHRIIAQTARTLRTSHVRSVVGDRLHAEMTPYDLTKDGSISREKPPGQDSHRRREHQEAMWGSDRLQGRRTRRATGLASGTNVLSLFSDRWYSGGARWPGRG